MPYRTAIPAVKKPNIPPFWLSLTVCIAAVALIAWLRLSFLSHKLLPLATGLPLLLALWNRDLRLLYGMAVAFTAISAVKIYVVLPSTTGVVANATVNMVFFLINIWLVAVVLHAMLNMMGRLSDSVELLRKAAEDLESRNDELSQTNHELSIREEEIARQNEELQCQTEELEQQAEELRQQAEEMEQQSADLHDANAELQRRERGMQTLLDTGRWLRGDLDEQLVVNGICEATAQVLGEDIDAVAIAEDQDGRYALHAHSGFGLADMNGFSFPFESSFAALVKEREATAYLADLELRPDLRFPPPATGAPFRSVLATPVWIEGKPTAVLEMYSRQVKEWTDHEFRIAEWLASQASLALQAIRFHRELEIRRGDAEEASRQKTRFLAAVSHDVRTPANAICLSAELIERVAADPAQRDMVPVMARSLRSNARSLVDLVSDVLDLTRFDAGRIDVQVSVFPLSPLLESEAKIAAPVVANKGIDLESTPPAPEIWLRTDRMKLARVLSNVIGNAVKFTEQGGIRILCERLADGGLNIHVADTGVGIPEAHLPHIFDEFFQLRNPERDHEKGTGLGLAICRRLLDAIGCDISVKSTVGSGTTFTIHLPSRLVERHPHLETEAEVEAAVRDDSSGEHFPPIPLDGLRILLVEDHHITRATLAKLLTADGATVTEAATGNEALAQLAAGSHQVLLLDLNLPDIDGTEVLKSLQDGRPDGLHCVLVLSGDTRPERTHEVSLLGADDVIPKPISIRKIVESLRMRCQSLRGEPSDH
jgi:signal transduction histidine kinase/ActR/RegA family two-component response regulator/vacuolar-type H+-ATPase subunit E/Vma4